MKLAAFLLLACLYGCSRTCAQSITLTERNTPIEKVFERIEKQTPYSFLYVTAFLKSIKPVTIDVVNASLKEVMNKCFAGAPVDYKIEGFTVVLRLSEAGADSAIRSHTAAQHIDVVSRTMIKGKVVLKDSAGEVLRGVNVVNIQTQQRIATDTSGMFELPARKEDQLVFSFVSMKKTLVIVDNINKVLVVGMARDIKLQEAITVVSTGYQDIPKERATGSFVLINNEQFNRRVSANVPDHLSDMVSGLAFNKNKQQGNSSDISIRGRSTLFANDKPLIVVDNFPYEGDLNNLNPNDIESVSILKDAAAASIWGVRAGNGVIVIVTKRGRLNKKPTISITANLVIGNKPDLYYPPQLSADQFIAAEQFLFNNGKYNAAINAGYAAISPVVEILVRRKAGLITAGDSASQMNSLAHQDVRADEDKYLYRKRISRQYALSVAGGGQHNRYYFSVGYDNDQGNLQTNTYKRLTLSFNNTCSFLNDKLELLTGILFANSQTASNALDYVPRYPYEKIADKNNNHLAVADPFGMFRLGYLDTAGAGKLMDWHYRPLDEQYANTTSRTTDYRLNAGITWHVISPLKIVLNYLYEKGSNDGATNWDKNSFYTRNMVNTFSQINSAGDVTRPVPTGNIADRSNNQYELNYYRGQVNYEQLFNRHHLIVAASGLEVRSYEGHSSVLRWYGYDPDLASNQNQSVNYGIVYPYYYGNGSGTIPAGTSSNTSTDRYISYYVNAAYTYREKYIVSASARKDASNLFGVNTNQKGVPLWSMGVMWNMGKEDFYPVDWLPLLKLRATYGYNGNIDKSTTAYLTTQSVSGFNNIYGVNYAVITNPPNPSLRWEKVRNINFGIDFSLKGNVLSGSIEYYTKKGIDLIGNGPIAPQAGITSFHGNTANTLTHGIDVLFNTKNINRQLVWTTTLLFNYVKDRVTKYLEKQPANIDIVNGNYNNPLEGYPYYAVFSFRYAGLDATGRPLGYLAGKVSNNYSAIVNSNNPQELVYNGPGAPVIFGSLRNTFRWKCLDLSFNISYKMNYYFRRYSINYTNLYYGSYTLQADYDNRWKTPGDEYFTNVPAMLYPANYNSDNLYSNADILVEKGDHARLQDIRIGFNYSPTAPAKTFFNNLSLYVYASNLGIIWRANKRGMDPDYPDGYPSPLSVAVGCKVVF